MTLHRPALLLSVAAAALWLGCTDPVSQPPSGGTTRDQSGRAGQPGSSGPAATPSPPEVKPEPATNPGETAVSAPSAPQDPREGEPVLIPQRLPEGAGSITPPGSAIISTSLSRARASGVAWWGKGTSGLARRVQ